MRILIATSPGAGHIFPTISTAAALRGAGHDVILANGGSPDLASGAGLNVVDTAPGVDFSAIFTGFHERLGGGPGMMGPRPGDDVTPKAMADQVGRLFAEVSTVTVDETVRLVRAWKPDLVLYSPMQGTGPLAAAVAGVPHVLHTIGPDQPIDVTQWVARHMSADYERFGVEWTAPAAVLDVTPTALRSPEAVGWSMRYVPYNGGAVLPSWLFDEVTRPRIIVTLGSVVPRMAGMGMLQPFLAGAGSVDADFVITLGGADPDALGAVPENVRLVDWLPLGPALATSAAVVHHGGAGTTLTALDAGVPALIIPQGADQFLNAAVVAKAGAGAVVEPRDLDAERLGELVEDTAMRSAARGIAESMAAQRPPADLVGDLISLAR